MSNFPQAYLKVQRADSHIRQLHNITSPLNPGLYSIAWEDGDAIAGGFEFDVIAEDPNTVTRQLVYKPTGPMPELFSCMIGDAIHNLRSALDYAATAVVRDKSFVTFPFHEGRESLEPAQSTGLKAIQEAFPEADVQGFFQDVIKSYRDGNYPLWAITKLDKIDKHNALVPTISVNNIRIPSFEAGTNRMSNMLHVGDVRETVALITTNLPRDHEMKENAEISVEVLFPKGEFFGNEAVVPTLVNLSKVTLEALQSFDRFIAEAKT